MSPFIGNSGGLRYGFGAMALAAAVSFAAGMFGPAGISAAFAQNATTVSATKAKAKSAAQRKAIKPVPAASQRKQVQANPKSEKGFIETIMQGPRITTTPPEAADWVRATRPDPNAQRQAARPPSPGRAVLTADQIRAQEAQLDSLRTRHDRVAGRKSPTGKFGSAAGKPEPAEAEKYKPGCVLTCSNSITVPRTQRR